MKKNSNFLIVLLLMLASFTPDYDIVRGDADQSGEVNVADVTTLIDYLLCGYWPDEESQPTSAETVTVNGVSFTMINVEGGTFMMGATAEQGTNYLSYSLPVHEVTLSSYSIGQTEVTQALWEAVMGWNRSRFTGDPQRPVEMVTWKECQTFITKLNQLTGKTFRLPTEAEWEFAARGGNYSQVYTFAGSNNRYDVAWCYYNASLMTHKVGLKCPNELGLYDMSGNVNEWCQDWFDYYTSEAQTDPTGPETGAFSEPQRVIRGGCCNYDVNSFMGDCRVSRRHYSPPQNAYDNVGLRLAL